MHGRRLDAAQPSISRLTVRRTRPVMPLLPSCCGVPGSSTPALGRTCRSSRCSGNPTHCSRKSSRSSWSRQTSTIGRARQRTGLLSKSARRRQCLPNPAGERHLKAECSAVPALQNLARESAPTPSLSRRHRLGPRALGSIRSASLINHGTTLLLGQFAPRLYRGLLCLNNRIPAHVLVETCEMNRKLQQEQPETEIAQA